MANCITCKNSTILGIRNCYAIAAAAIIHQNSGVNPIYSNNEEESSQEEDSSSSQLQLAATRCAAVEKPCIQQ